MTDQPQREVRLGYQPDDGHRLLVSLIAGSIIGGALVAVFPALWHLNIPQAPGWSRAVLLLAILQIGYGIWLAMTPDFSSLWVMMFVLGAIAAAYATVIAMFVIAAPTSDLIFGLGELRRSKGSLPLVWSSAIAGLTAALAYACGHVSVRWRKRVLRKKRQKDV